MATNADALYRPGLTATANVTNSSSTYIHNPYLQMSIMGRELTVVGRILSPTAKITGRKRNPKVLAS